MRCGFLDSGNELDTYGELGVFSGKYQTRPSLPLTEQWYLLSLESFSLFVGQSPHRFAGNVDIVMFKFLAIFVVELFRSYLALVILFLA